MTDRPLVLPEEGRISPLIDLIVKYIENRIDDCRKQNDNPASGVSETAALRGRIAELKKLVDVIENARKP